MKFLIGLPMIFHLLACDSGNKCVADCDEAGANDGSGSGSSDDTADSGSSPACEAAADDAEAFLLANQGCESSLECGLLNAFCYPGQGGRVCTEVPVNMNVDLTPWIEAYSVLETCGPCGGDPCGADEPFCNSEGQCEATIDSARICEALEEEYTEFVVANGACEVDADCVHVEASCYQGPEKTCTAVSVNADADLTVLEELDDRLMACGNECGGNECGASIECIDNKCESTFP